MPLKSYPNYLGPTKLVHRWMLFYNTVDSIERLLSRPLFGISYIKKIIINKKDDNLIIPFIYRLLSRTFWPLIQADTAHIWAAGLLSHSTNPIMHFKDS